MAASSNRYLLALRNDYAFCRKACAIPTVWYKLVDALWPDKATTESEVLLSRMDALRDDPNRSPLSDRQTGAHLSNHITYGVPSTSLVNDY